MAPGRCSHCEVSCVILNSVEVMFGGQAGDGSLTTGDLIGRVFKRMGLEGLHVARTSRPAFRGGHTNYVIRASENHDYGMADAVDGLVAFDLEAVEAHIDEMRPGGCSFVFDDTRTRQIPGQRPGRRRTITWYEIPLAKIAKEMGLELIRNTISLGVLGALGRDGSPRSLRHDVRGVSTSPTREGRRPQPWRADQKRARTTCASTSQTSPPATASPKEPTATGSS